MTIHEIDQRSEEWYDLRLGRVGGSECAPFLVDGTNKTGLGAGAITLLCTKVAEIITGEMKANFTNEDMERGQEYEPLARKQYERSNFVSVRQVGYVSDGDYFGCSPDGLVGNDGMIEIKCPSGPEFVRYTLKYRKEKDRPAKLISKPHYAQMQWGLRITGRKWCDFIVYHPDFAVNLLTVRVYPDPEIQVKFDKAVTAYTKAIESALRVMREPALV